METNLEKSTKEKILDAALIMFSEYGFKGSNLRDLAQSLGITKTALYRHYDNKDAIWDALIDKVEEYYKANFEVQRKGRALPENAAELKAMTLGQLNFTMHDQTVQKVRKLLQLEQFKDDKMACLASQHFVDGILAQYKMVFTHLRECDMVLDDPEMLALEYTSPITQLLHIFDRQPEREGEVMGMINKHIEFFIDKYFIKGE